jgi:glutamyl-Q tRNA(Asp) synthetase
LRKRRFLPDSSYRGRFAPSPTGPLHFGSLVAAIGSYLDAKHHQGQWLVRIEDLDTPRTVKGAAKDILRTLEAFGLHWDEAVLYQSQRTDAYEEALLKLQSIGAVYPCTCTRKEIADSALHGIDGIIYPGTCRNKTHPLPNPPPLGEGMTAARASAWRVRTNTPFQPSSLGKRSEPDPLSHRGRVREGEGFIEFNDILQGPITQHLENEIGDFVVKRADGLFAYQLAVVVDDAFQRITHVVRGSDLLSSTPRQIYLQQLFGLVTPAYMHLPVAVNAKGEKLSKQTLAAPVDSHNVSSALWSALQFLHQEPPVELESSQRDEILDWATLHWSKHKLTGFRQIS